MSRPTASAVGLPARPFLYTIDQIATILGVEVEAVKDHLHFDGRSVGARSKKIMLARNIAAEGERPDWRVAERELIRWLRFRGFRVIERAYVSV